MAMEKTDLRAHENEAKGVHCTNQGVQYRAASNLVGVTIKMKQIDCQDM